MFEELLSPTLITVLFGSTLLGVAAGVMGCFALLRRQSLLGDALAHAALPGICVAYLLIGRKDTLAFFFGALVFALLGALFSRLVVRSTRVKEDASLGIVLSVFFGVGIVLLTAIQKMPGGGKAGLDSFLFGQAATLLREDIALLACVALVVLLAVLTLYRPLKLLCFDPDFAAQIGIATKRLDVLLTVLLVAVVVVGLQTVGVVLMVASLVIPAAAARQWTDRFGRMLFLGGFFGGLSAALGTLISASAARLPTGPIIVLVAGGLLVLSLLFAPRRGLLWIPFRRATR
jgi:manganese/zinc/iron transport system permease protein